MVRWRGYKVGSWSWSWSWLLQGWGVVEGVEVLSRWMWGRGVVWKSWGAGGVGSGGVGLELYSTLQEGKFWLKVSDRMEVKKD